MHWVPRRTLFVGVIVRWGIVSHCARLSFCFVISQRPQGAEKSASLQKVAKRLACNANAQVPEGHHPNETSSLGTPDLGHPMHGLFLCRRLRRNTRQQITTHEHEKLFTQGR